MNALFERLHPKERRGSKPRCHLLTHGPAPEVAARLTALIAPYARVRVDDAWMPCGFDQLEECELDKATRLLGVEDREALATWWLPAGRARARTPNFDIASTCEIEGRRGLLLVEAKAHDEELKKESAGRKITEGDSEDRKASHATIGAAIEDARLGLTTTTSLSWRISRDSHYQMSNRFAWSWKLASLGIPVALVYLGFLKATEMADRGDLFDRPSDWEQLVLAHSESLFPPTVWGRRWMIGAVPFVPLVKAMDQPLG